MRSFLIAGTLCTLAVPSVALAQTACPLGYPAFEFAVPHLDLETCPSGVPAEGVFCRASIAGDALNVFVFEEEGEQCLTQMVSLSQDQFSLTLE